MCYSMERDSRRGHGQWRGCFAFQNIVCDDENPHHQKRSGGLKMGHTYYYYVSLVPFFYIIDASPLPFHLPSRSMLWTNLQSLLQLDVSFLYTPFNPPPVLLCVYPPSHIPSLSSLTFRPFSTRWTGQLRLLMLRCPTQLPAHICLAKQSILFTSLLNTQSASEVHP